MPLIDVPKVHAVTDLATLSRPGFPSLARGVMDALGPLGAVHLRAEYPHGTGAAGLLYNLARRLAPDAARSGAWLVINDRVDVALALARTRIVSGLTVGAQLSQRSLSAAAARALREKVAGGTGPPGLNSGAPESTPATAVKLGVSVHSAAEANEAASGSPDWLIAGAVFPTESHPDRPARGAELLAELGYIPVPLVAIGGITADRVAPLLSAGWYGVAAIRGIWGAEDPGRAAEAYFRAAAVR